MNQHTPNTQAAPVQELAPELAPAAGEAGESLGPLAKRLAGTEPRKDGAANTQPRNLEMVMRIPVTVKIVLGSATMPVANLLNLERGAVIPLDRKVNEPVDVVVNGRVVARGEIVVVDEGGSRFGISLTEVVGPSGTDKAA